MSPLGDVPLGSPHVGPIAENDVYLHPPTSYRPTLSEVHEMIHDHIKELETWLLAHLDEAFDEARNVVPDANDDQAARIEAMAAIVRAGLSDDQKEAFIRAVER